jgi:hypothetical protein
MTHIAQMISTGESFKSKKQLKEAMLESPESVYFRDPSIFNPRSYRGDEIPSGVSFVCTNHPKRSWFAQIISTGGRIKVL